MSTPSFRDRYLEALGITLVGNRPDGENARKLKAALSRAHEIRQFEIELYWKRAAYFWAFQLVAFTALGLLFKDGELKHPGLLTIPGIVGAITAFAGYLTARGSKFWQENWEAHVDLLESETRLHLTQVIICRKAPQFSVSRTNQFLLMLLTIGWGSVLIVSAIPNATGYLGSISPFRRSIVVVIITSLACALLYWRSQTDLKGRAFHAEGSDWVAFPSDRKVATPFLIWRDRIDGEPHSSPTAEKEDENKPEDKLPAPDASSGG
ncbi:MAG: hypothetical protein LAP21_10265 [Acidobacteriia bacterium]|nr:hypothetical protein [Terriglobia bacterium]